MKALVPSGGRGIRLRPITHTSAKQLVPVANKPILHYVLDDIARAQITEVGIVVGDTAAEIEESVGDGSAFGLKVTYLRQDEPRGLAHTVLIAREFLGEEPFLMYLGDNMLRDGVAAFVAGYDGSAAHIMVAAVREPERFGVVVLDGERVVRVVEKPVEHVSDLALVGVYLFGPAVHEAVGALKPSARGELEITEAIQTLVDAGERVGVHRVEGWWKDTGHLEDLLEANRLVLATMESSSEGTVDDSDLDGTVVLQRGARVEGSRLRGPLIIGERTIVRGSVIGPNTAIGPDCEIVDAEIDDSVILEECSITGSLTGSLLGRGVVVTRGGGPRARLMVGDHGRVEIAD